MGAPKGNTNAKGCTTSGRPSIFKSPEELEEKINEYFEYIQGEKDGEQQVTLSKNGVIETRTEPKWIREPEPPTITGLALFVGFGGKSTMYDYINKVEFSEPLKRAVSYVEKSYELALRNNSCTGAIFALKNMGWMDSQTIEHATKDKVKVSLNIDGQGD